MCIHIPGNVHATVNAVKNALPIHSFRTRFSRLMDMFDQIKSLAGGETCAVACATFRLLSDCKALWAHAVDENVTHP